MWAKFLEWLFNPVSIITIIMVVLMAVGGVFYTIANNSAHENDLLKLENKSQSEVIDAQKNAIQVYKKDSELLADLSDKQINIIVKQQALEKELNEIPDTSTNKPFTNPDLLRAAGVLRNYQSSQTTTSTSSSNN